MLERMQEGFIVDLHIEGTRRFWKRLTVEDLGLAMEGDFTAAENAKTGLLRVRPEFSLRWMGENLPPSGEFGQRVREAPEHPITAAKSPSRQEPVLSSKGCSLQV